MSCGGYEAIILHLFQKHQILILFLIWELGEQCSVLVGRRWLRVGEEHQVQLFHLLITFYDPSNFEVRNVTLISFGVTVAFQHVVCVLDGTDVDDSN